MEQMSPEISLNDKRNYPKQVSKSMYCWHAHLTVSLSIKLYKNCTKMQ